jgi:hypothetical protein
VVVKPYDDIAINDNMFVRRFYAETDPSEYVWHRDSVNRHITVVYGEGWSIQFDNCLPKKIKQYDTVHIPKNQYHRLIPGDTDLVLEIQENRGLFKRLFNFDPMLVTIGQVAFKIDRHGNSHRLFFTQELLKLRPSENLIK